MKREEMQREAYLEYTVAATRVTELERKLEVERGEEKLEAETRKALTVTAIVAVASEAAEAAEVADAIAKVAAFEADPDILASLHHAVEIANLKLKYRFEKDERKKEKQDKRDAPVLAWEAYVTHSRPGAPWDPNVPWEDWKTRAVAAVTEDGKRRSAVPSLAKAARSRAPVVTTAAVSIVVVPAAEGHADAMPYHPPGVHLVSSSELLTLESVDAAAPVSSWPRVGSVVTACMAAVRTVGLAVQSVSDTIRGSLASCLPRTGTSNATTLAAGPVMEMTMSSEMSKRKRPCRIMPTESYKCALRKVYIKLKQNACQATEALLGSKRIESIPQVGKLNRFLRVCKRKCSDQDFRELKKAKTDPGVAFDDAELDSDATADAKASSEAPVVECPHRDSFLSAELDPRVALFKLHDQRGRNEVLLINQLGDPDATAEAKAAIEATVVECLHQDSFVSMETKLECAREFMKRNQADIALVTCGACGERDPDVVHVVTKLGALPNCFRVSKVTIKDLMCKVAPHNYGDVNYLAAHTIHPKNWYKNLDVAAMEAKEENRESNVYRELYHLHSYTVFADKTSGAECTHFCPRCFKACKVQPQGTCADAPKFSVAAGHDYGQPDALNLEPLTVVENIILSGARIGGTVIKLTAMGHPTEKASTAGTRLKLDGHMITFLQDGLDKVENILSEAGVKKLEDLIIVAFVGPEGERDRLMNEAMKHQDMRVRPEVLFHWLRAKRVLQGEHMQTEITLDRFHKLYGDFTKNLVKRAAERMQSDSVSLEIERVMREDTDDKAKTRPDGYESHCPMKHSARMPREGIQLVTECAKDDMADIFCAVRDALGDIDPAPSERECDVPSRTTAGAAGSRRDESSPRECNLPPRTTARAAGSKVDASFDDLDDNGKLVAELLRHPKFAFAARTPAEQALTTRFLSEVEERLCDRTLGEGSDADLVASDYGQQEGGLLRRGDMRRMRNGIWLNDEIVNAVQELMADRDLVAQQRDGFGGHDGQPRNHFFSSFFMKKLRGKDGYNYPAVRRWTTHKKLQYDMLACEKLFVPVHHGLHWKLVVIDLKRCTITLYDSLLEPDPGLLHDVRRWIVTEYAAEASRRPGRLICPREWTLQTPTNIPMQCNYDDCAVFMLKFAECIASGCRITFNQTDVPFFRRRILADLLSLRVPVTEGTRAILRTEPGLIVDSDSDEDDDMVVGLERVCVDVDSDSGFEDDVTVVECHPAERVPVPAVTGRAVAVRHKLKSGLDGFSIGNNPVDSLAMVVSCHPAERAPVPAVAIAVQQQLETALDVFSVSKICAKLAFSTSNNPVERLATKGEIERGEFKCQGVPHARTDLELTIDEAFRGVATTADIGLARLKDAVEISVGAMFADVERVQMAFQYRSGDEHEKRLLVLMACERHAARLSRVSEDGGPRTETSCPPVVNSKREDDPINEFTSNGELLQTVFWMHFFLGKGTEQVSGTLSSAHVQHLLKQHDNRFANDRTFIFMAANQMQRHAAARAVNVHVKQSTEKIKAIMDLVTSPGFSELLAAAALDPEGEEAKRVTREVLPHVEICGKRIPFGSGCRAGTTTTIFGYQRMFGTPCAFVTMSPDDSKSMLGIRLSLKGPDQTVVDGAEEPLLFVLQNRNAVPSTMDEDGSHVFTRRRDDGGTDAIPLRVCDKALHALASENPVAAARAFKRLIEAFMECLLGLEPSYKVRKTVAPSSRKPGIFGKVTAFIGAVEVQKRLALHIHYILWGGLSPEVLRRALQSDVVRQKIEECIQSQFQTELPDALHCADALRTAAGVPATRPSLCPPTAEECNDIAALTRKGQYAAKVVNSHSHSPTCHKPPHGVDSCREAMPCRHNLQATTFVQVIETPKDLDGVPPTPSVDHPDVPEGCACVGKVKLSPGDVKWAEEITAEIYDDLNGRDRLTNPLAPRDKRTIQIYHQRNATNFRHPPEKDPQAPVTVDEVKFWLANDDVRGFATSLNPQLLAKIDELMETDAPAFLKKLNRVKHRWPCSNAWVVDRNDIASACLGCNTSMNLLGSEESARAALFYLIKYLTKDDVKLSACVSVLSKAFKHIQDHPSVAEDTGTAQRTTMHFLMRAVNSRGAGDMELSDTQAAAMLLGVPAIVQSHDPIFCHPRQALQWISALRARVGGAADEESVEGREDENPEADEDADDVGLGKPRRDESDRIFRFEQDCEYENIDDLLGHGVKRGAAAPDAQEGAVEVYRGVGGVPVVMAQAAHYAFRGEALKDFSLYEWTAMISVGLKKKEPPPKITGAGRPRNSTFDFHPDHELFLTHTQSLRSKFLVPLLSSTPPPAYPIAAVAGSINKPGKHKAKEEFAAYALVLYKPWSFDSLPGGSWPTFCAFLDECEAHGDLTDTDAIGRGRSNFVHSLAFSMTVSSRIKRCSQKDRRLQATKWATDPDPAHAHNPQGGSTVDDVTRQQAADLIDKITGKSKEGGLSNKSLADMAARDKLTDGLSRTLDGFAPAYEPGVCIADGTNTNRSIAPSSADSLTQQCVFSKAPFPRTPANEPSSSIAAVDRANKEMEEFESKGVPKEVTGEALNDDGSGDGAGAPAPTPVTEAQRAGLCLLEVDPFAVVTPDKLAALELTYRNGDKATAHGDEVLGPLNHEQRAACRPVIAFVRDEERYERANIQEKATMKAPKAPIIVLHGPAGTGKTHIMHVLGAYMKSQGLGTVGACAPTGMAALAIDGVTHFRFASFAPKHSGSPPSMSSGPKSAKPPNYMVSQRQPMTTLQKNQVKTLINYEEMSCIFLDELSMVPAHQLSMFSLQVEDIIGGGKGPFGNKPVFLVGDFFQLPPVMAKPIYASVINMMVLDSDNLAWNGSFDEHGVNLILSATKVELTRQMRANEPMQAGFVATMRDMECVHPFKEPQVKALEAAVVTLSDYSSQGAGFDPFTLYAVPSNAERRVINLKQADRFATVRGVPVVHWRTPVSGQVINRLRVLDADLDPADPDPANLPLMEELYRNEPDLTEIFVEGAPAFVDTNLSVGMGIANGRDCTMHSLVMRTDELTLQVRRMIEGASPGQHLHLPEPPIAVNASFALGPSQAAAFLKRGPNMCFGVSGADNGLVVVPMILQSQRGGGSKPGEYNVQSKWAKELSIALFFTHGIPLELGFAMTVHKLQGKTLRHLILNLAYRSFKPDVSTQNIIVALSRVKEFRGLRIVPLSLGADLSHLYRKHHDPKLLAWMGGYNADGKFDPDLAKAKYEWALGQITGSARLRNNEFLDKRDKKRPVGVKKPISKKVPASRAKTSAPKSAVTKRQPPPLNGASAEIGRFPPAASPPSGEHGIRNPNNGCFLIAWVQLMAHTFQIMEMCSCTPAVDTPLKKLLLDLRSPGGRVVHIDDSLGNQITGVAVWHQHQLDMHHHALESTLTHFGGNLRDGCQIPDPLGPADSRLPFAGVFENSTATMEDCPLCGSKMIEQPPNVTPDLRNSVSRGLSRNHIIDISVVKGKHGAFLDALGDHFAKEKLKRVAWRGCFSTNGCDCPSESIETTTTLIDLSIKVETRPWRWVHRYSRLTVSADGTLPKCLLLSVNRTLERSPGVYAPFSVRITLATLDVKPYMAAEDSNRFDAREMMYQVQCVVLRDGLTEHESGHFYAYIRHDDGKWYIYDDDRPVVAAGTDGTLSDDDISKINRIGYILRYEQQSEIDKRSGGARGVAGVPKGVTFAEGLKDHISGRFVYDTSGDDAVRMDTFALGRAWRNLAQRHDASSSSDVVLDAITWLKMANVLNDRFDNFDKTFKINTLRTHFSSYLKARVDQNGAEMIRLTGLMRGDINGKNSFKGCRTPDSIGNAAMNMAYVLESLLVIKKQWSYKIVCTYPACTTKQRRVYAKTSVFNLGANGADRGGPLRPLVVLRELQFNILQTIPTNTERCKCTNGTLDTQFDLLDPTVDTRHRRPTSLAKVSPTPLPPPPPSFIFVALEPDVVEDLNITVDYRPGSLRFKGCDTLHRYRPLFLLCKDRNEHHLSALNIAAVVASSTAMAASSGSTPLENWYTFDGRNSGHQATPGEPRQTIHPRFYCGSEGEQSVRVTGVCFVHTEAPR